MQPQRLFPGGPFGPQSLQRLAGLLPPEALRGPAEVTEHLQQHPECASQVVQALLPSLEEADEPQTIIQSRYQEAVDFIQWLACGGELHDVLVMAGQISEAGTMGGVCGSVWGHNDIAYRCKTCEHDPTCAICVACFLDGDHEGHDYSMIRTGGGCCDCGDPTAWKETGFCKKHRGPGSAPPLPGDFIKRAKPVLENLCVEWVRRLAQAGAQSEGTSQGPPPRQWGAQSKEQRSAGEATRAISGMLLRLCSASEGLLNLVSGVVAEPSIGALQMLMRNERTLPSGAVEASHALLYKLLGDPDFKHAFARVFIGFYPQFLRDLREDSVFSGNSQSLLDSFSVQIFTVPALTPHLVEEAGLLDMLLETLKEVLYAAAGEDGRIDMNRSAIKTKHNRVTDDLRYVLSHAESAGYATSVRPELSRTWLQQLAYVQGMCPQKRQTLVHIEQETEDWSYAYLLEVQMGIINPLFTEGAASSGARETIHREDATVGWNGAGPSRRWGEETRWRVGSLRDPSSSEVEGEAGQSGSTGFPGPQSARISPSLSSDSGTTVKIHGVDLPFALVRLLSDCAKVVATWLALDHNRETGHPVPPSKGWLTGPVPGNSDSQASLRRTTPAAEQPLGGVLADGMGGRGLARSVNGDGDAAGRGRGLLGTLLRRRRSMNEEAAALADAEMTREGDSGLAREEENAVVGMEVQGGIVEDVSEVECERLLSTFDTDFVLNMGGKDPPTGFAGESHWPSIKFDVERQEISLHIPLHRMLALLLHRVLENFGMPTHRTSKKSQLGNTAAASSHTPASGGGSLLAETSAASLPPGRLQMVPSPEVALESRARELNLQELLPEKFRTVGFPAAVMEHPLRVAVVCSQVQAGMWRRNGHSMTSLSELYHSVHWCEDSLELDIFLLQFCAALAPPEEFVERVQQRWGLSSYFTLDNCPPVEYEASLARDLLCFLIQIVSERTLCGLSALAALRRELVQRLAVGDATHSSLVKSLPPRLADNPHLPAVLAAVASYSTPSGMHQGKYVLKPECWHELDMHHPRWSQRELQRAEERYRHVIKASVIANQVPRWKAPLAPFEPLKHLATTARVHDMLLSVFHHASLDAPGVKGRAPDGVLHAALHLLALALDTLKMVPPGTAGEADDTAGLGSGSDRGPGASACYFSQSEPARSALGGDQLGNTREQNERPPLLSLACMTFPMGEGVGSGDSVHRSLLSLLVLLFKKWGGTSASMAGGFGSGAGRGVGGGAQGDEEGRHELAELVLRLLQQFAQLDEDCRRELEGLAPELFGVGRAVREGEGAGAAALAGRPGGTDSEAERRKMLAKAKQAAALAQMMAAQQQFAASLGAEEGSEEDEEGSMQGGAATLRTAPLPEAEEQGTHGLTCALCREFSSTSSPLCYIVLAQRSKLLSIADAPVPSWEKGPAVEAVEGAREPSEGGPLAERDENEEALMETVGTMEAVDLVRWIHGVLDMGGGAEVTVEGPGGQWVMHGDDIEELLREAAGVVERAAELEEEMGAEAGDDGGAMDLDGTMHVENEEDVDMEDEREEERGGDVQEAEMEGEETLGVAAVGADGGVEAEARGMPGEGVEGGQEGLGLRRAARGNPAASRGLQGEELDPESRGEGEQWRGADPGAAQGQEAPPDPQAGPERRGGRDGVEEGAESRQGRGAEAGGSGEGSSRPAGAGRRGAQEGGARDASGSGTGAGESQARREAEETERAVLARYVEAARQARQDREASGREAAAGGRREGGRREGGAAMDRGNGPAFPRAVRRRGMGARPGGTAGTGEEKPADPQVGVQLLGCGHAIHQECFDRYFSSLLQRYLSRTLYEGANVVDLEMGEFLCPMCRRLANATLPALPPSAIPAASQASVPESSLALSPQATFGASLGLRSVLSPSPSLKAAFIQGTVPSSEPRPNLFARSGSMSGASPGGHERKSHGVVEEGGRTNGGAEGAEEMAGRRWTCSSQSASTAVSPYIVHIRDGIAAVIAAEMEVRSVAFSAVPSPPLPPRVQEALEAFVSKLCQVAHPERDRFAGLVAGREHQGLHLWEALWYTVGSAELAARGGPLGAPPGSNGAVQATTPRTAVGLHLPSLSARVAALAASIDEKKGSILPAIATVAVAQRSHSEQAVLLRARGMQMLVGTLLWGMARDRRPSAGAQNRAAQGGSAAAPTSSQASAELAAASYMEHNPTSDDVIFWHRVADPVLATDAFSTLAHLLFCLPNGQPLQSRLFVNLVNFVYMVTVTQAIARLSRSFPIDIPELSPEAAKVVSWISSVTAALPGMQRYVDTASPPSSSAAALALIRRHTLPFLRRCALLQQLLFGDVQPLTDTSAIPAGLPGTPGQAAVASQGLPAGAEVPVLQSSRAPSGLERGPQPRDAGELARTLLSRQGLMGVEQTAPDGFSERGSGSGTAASEEEFPGFASGLSGREGVPAGNSGSVERPELRPGPISGGEAAEGPSDGPGRGASFTKSPLSPQQRLSEALAEQQAFLELEEVEVWEGHFALPPLLKLMEEGAFFSFVVRWLKGVAKGLEARGVRQLALPGTAAPFELLRLPHRFHDLFQRHVKERCQQCGVVPEQPALCLLCGALCCGTRRRDTMERGRNRQGGCGEAFRHARRCAAGTGLFLMLRRSNVLLLRGERYTIWPSPYLDAYGEEDENLRRGKPLFLSQERYAALTTLVASHGLDHNTAVLSQTNRWPMF